MSKKFILIILVVITIVLGSFYVLKNNLSGGGGSAQNVPDTIKTGETAVIKLELSVWGSSKGIQGRYTDVSLNYRKVGEENYKSLTVNPVPVIFTGEQEKFNGYYESYVFTIPPYAKGTSGEIEYYFDVTLDGQKSRVNGIKKIKLIDEEKQNTTNSLSQFNKEITFKVKDKFTFTDGLVLELKEINDSRCPKDVQCVWAGEISGLFMASGGKLLKSGEVRVGTTNNKSVNLENYNFSLQSATENSVTIMVQYKKLSGSVNNCYVGGCSGQICSDKEDTVSTCEYNEKYACYKTAKCERQTNGQCGWTQTPKLNACLSHPTDASIIY